MITIIKEILSENIKNIKSYKILVSYLEIYLSKKNIGYPPDWIGIIFIISLFTISSIGISAETPIVFGSYKYFDINIIINSMILITLISQFFINIVIDNKAKTILEYKSISKIKKYIITLTSVFLSPSVLILFLIFIFIPIFSYSYKLTTDIYDYISYIYILILIYFISTVIISVISNINGIKKGIKSKLFKSLVWSLSIVLVIIINRNINISLYNSLDLLGVIISLTIISFFLMILGYFLYKFSL